jgi:hypothetical protein
VRHRETGYDALLARCMDRLDARVAVGGEVDAGLVRWRG